MHMRENARLRRFAMNMAVKHLRELRTIPATARREIQRPTNRRATLKRNAKSAALDWKAVNTAIAYLANAMDSSRKCNRMAISQLI